MRLLALAAVAALSLVLGFAGRRWFNPEAALVCTGYWAMALLALGWLAVAAHWWRRHGPSLWPLLGWRGVIWAVCAWGFLISREPVEFKIVMDEPLLASTSLGMYLHRSPVAPAREYEVNGQNESVSAVVDKRPLLFPFLVSLVHDVSGYRVQNVFWLNRALVLLLVVLAWVAGRSLDSQFGGPLVLLWFCGWPLLAQNACGGGFEVLNLVLVLTVFLAAIRYIEDRCAVNEVFLVATCLLLANARYESGLYLFVFASIWLVGAIRQRSWSVSWGTVVSPLLLLPCLWQRVMVVSSERWNLELADRAATNAWGMGNVTNNLVHAWRFFTIPDPTLAGSALFGWLGLLALAALPLVVLRAWRCRECEAKAPLNAAVLVAVVVLGGFCVLLAYFWGELDDPVVSRLALPLIGGMGLALCAVRPRLLPSPGIRRILFGTMAVWFIGYVLPVVNEHRYTQNGIHVRIFNWSREVIGMTAAERPLVISPHARMWTPYRIAAMIPAAARQTLAQIESQRAMGTIDQVFVVQSLFENPSTGQCVLLPGNELPEGVELETVAESRFRPLNRVRVSRVRSIALAPAGSGPAPTALSRRAEIFREATPEEMRLVRDRVFK